MGNSKLVSKGSLQALRFGIETKRAIREETKLLGQVREAMGTDLEGRIIHKRVADGQ